MKFLIIIPAHNEEQNIGFCLQSLANQTFRDFRVVVVNDGSTDKTQEIAEELIKKNGNQLPASIFHLPASSHSPGAKVVDTFNKGLETQNLVDFDVICKFDADIVFSENYLEEVDKIYEANPKAGMVSGLVYIRDSSFPGMIKKPVILDEAERNEESLYHFSNKDNWIFENLSSKNHVRGPIKSYKKECFLAMNGLRPVLGWDNIDVMLCKKHGFEVITLKEIWVKHLRPTAYKYKNQKAEKLGEYFYNIGLNLPLTLISSAKSSMKNKSFSEFFITMKSFLKQKQERKLSKDEIKYIRNLRWKEMFKKF
ncbi:MAG: glycosyltransferase [Bergeyella sp.]